MPASASTGASSLWRPFSSGLPEGRPPFADGRRRRRAAEPPPTRRRTADGRACRGRRRRRRGAVVPGPHSSSLLGSLPAAIAVPGVSGFPARRTGGRRSAARGELTAELVEVLNSAPELAVYGPRATASTVSGRPTHELVRLARRDAFAGGVGDGLALLVVGVRRSPVCSPARSRRPRRGQPRPDADRDHSVTDLASSKPFSRSRPRRVTSRDPRGRITDSSH